MFWQGDAQCTPQQADDFFPAGDERLREVKVQYDYLRTICNQCPVKKDCLDEAIRRGWDEVGMFGGATPKERRRIARGLAA